MFFRMRLLGISGSLRARSTTAEVLLAAKRLAPSGVTLELYGEVAELPHFNPDNDTEGSVPPDPVRRLRDAVGGASGLLICSPEYAHGVPGSLKNALDWLVSGPEMIGKPVLLLSASTRATFAQEQLAETLRTMSVVLVGGAALVIPLYGRRLDAATIAESPELAEPLQAGLDALLASGPA